ncbi:hypothetical protein EJB05_27859, partial [Eragrostis curvula]
MGKLWTILSHLHSLAGPTVTLLYPLYESVQVMESSSKLDGKIPIWYDLKLLFMAWLVLPNFRGAAFIYDKFVRGQVNKHNGVVVANANNNDMSKLPSPPLRQKKTKRKLFSF